MSAPVRRARRAALRSLGVAAAGAALPAAVRAQGEPFPSRPVRLVVGYPPGGSVDAVGRILADGLGPALGTSIVVENQSGAAGVVAAQRVVGSPPDGYTLLAGSSNELAGTGVLNPAQKYDARRDLVSIGLAGSAGVLLATSPRTGVRTLAEFVDRVKRNPGKFSYGSSGVGSSLHFAGELIKLKAGLFMVHIPYRGVAPLVADLMGGVLDFAMISPSGAAPFLKDGRLIALGASSAQRMAILPQVPAFAEHPALKGYELVGWFALMAPRGVPQPVLDRLRQAMQATLADAGIRRRLEEQGLVVASGREDVGRLIEADVVQMTRIADFAKMREQ